MNERAFLESRGRLEALKSGGRLVAAKRAIETGHPFVEQFGLNVQATLDALDMSPGQLEATGTPPTQLEAIVRLVTRPPMVVEDGSVSLIPLPDDFGADIDLKIKRNEHWIGSVGRVEFVNHSMSWGGTAWVIGEEADGRHFLVATNRHVAKIVARRTAKGEGVFIRSPFTMVRYGARVDFNEEVGSLPSDARPADILRFTYLADDASADVAIGRIEKPDGFDLAPLPLVDTDAETDEIVAVIGYPAFDSRNDRTEMEKYFKGLYDVKRFAPGKMMPVTPGTVLSHDCTTLGGNSGSPVLSLDRNKVVGLHFAGAYGIANSAVRASTLRDLLSGTRPTQILVEESLTQEVADGFHEPDHFAGRDGYDPDFLSAKVDFPKLPHGMFNLASPADATQDRPHELRYTHFGLLHDLDRRSPVVTAVNIDGEKAIKIKRKKPDKWFFDKRIPMQAQLGKGDFPGDLDRGHMVRREDPNWGDDRGVAQLANDDTFHYTNASPQHASLNQNRSTWQGLENHILDSTRTHGFRATVFTGPLFDDDEDPFLDSVGINLPLQYWKVVVMDALQEDDSLQLHATAYLLSQGLAIQKYMQDRHETEAVEGFAFGEYKTFQVSVAFLEELSGFDFGPLRDADPLAALADDLELPASRPRFVEITGGDTLIL
jgi:endonuclease G